MTAFNQAWAMLKALPEQQAFDQFYTHGRPGSLREFGYPPTFEEIPRIAQERRGTVHPAIIAMLQRAKARESGGSYFPDDRASLLIQRENDPNITVRPPFNQRSRKNAAGFMLQSVPDRVFGHNDPDRYTRDTMEGGKRRQEDAGSISDDFEFYVPEGGDAFRGEGKYRSIRQKTPDGQDIVTAGSVFADPSYPDLDYEARMDSIYDRPTYEEQYGEPPVGRDTRFMRG